MKAIVALAFAVLAAQQIELPTITETVDVIVVNLDVVVTDRDGKAVRGLKADDFEVFENAKPQPITNFSEIASSAQAEPSTPTEAEDPPRQVIVFIDNLSLDFFHRKRVLAQLTGFLRMSIRARDEAMIVSWNRGLKIEVPPTNDLRKLEAGVDAVLKTVSAGALAQQRKREFYSGTTGPTAMASRERLLRARQYAAQEAQDAEQTAKAVSSVLTRMAGVSGRKIMVLVTEGLDPEPGRGVLGTVEGGQEQAEAEFAANEYEKHQLVETITRAANASGVTIYSIHAAGTGSGSDVEDSSMNAAIDRNAADASSIAALTVIANKTGGLVTARTGAFERAFARIAADLSNYYSLGYRATSARVDGERKLEVRARNREYVVRTRRSFVDRSPETEIRDRVVANLFFTPQHSTMRIGARAGDPRRAKGGGVSVPVEIQVPITALTFLPSGDQYVAGFSVFVTASDEHDATSDVVERKQRISFAAADLPKTSGAYYTYVFDLETQRGNRISLAVVDELSKVTGFARLQVPKKTTTSR
jgi:VWFA-related protein